MQKGIISIMFSHLQRSLSVILPKYLLIVVSFIGIQVFALPMSSIYARVFLKYLPAVLRGFDESYRTFDVETENAYMKQNFPSYPNISVDYAILEKSDNVSVMKCDFGWADLGTWHSIYEAMQKSEDDNVIIRIVMSWWKTAIVMSSNCQRANSQFSMVWMVSL